MFIATDTATSEARCSASHVYVQRAGFLRPLTRIHDHNSMRMCFIMTCADIGGRTSMSTSMAHMLSLGGPSLWRSRYCWSTRDRRSCVDSPFWRGRDAMGVLGIRLRSKADACCRWQRYVRTTATAEALFKKQMLTVTTRNDLKRIYGETHEHSLPCEPDTMCRVTNTVQGASQYPRS